MEDYKFANFEEQELFFKLPDVPLSTLQQYCPTLPDYYRYLEQPPIVYPVDRTNCNTHMVYDDPLLRHRTYEIMKQFYNLRALRSRGQIAKCIFCGRFSRNFFDHINSHHAVILTAQCIVCKCDLSTMLSYGKHLQNKHNFIFVDDTTKASFTIKYEEARKYTCDSCKKPFQTNKHAMHKSAQKDTNVLKVQLHTCNVCNISFKCKSGLETHFESEIHKLQQEEKDNVPSGSKRRKQQPKRYFEDGESEDE